MLHDFVMAIPWPEFLYIGLPAFAAGVFTGRFSAARPTRRIR